MTQAQTQATENSFYANAAESVPDQATVDESAQAPAEAVAAVELEAGAIPAVAAAHDSRRPLNLMSVVDQTMRKGMSSAHGETLNAPRHNVGQGFAKWISKAVGTTALKEKTEIQDLPAYRLRVSTPPLQPFLQTPSSHRSLPSFDPPQTLNPRLHSPPQTPFLKLPSSPPHSQMQLGMYYV